MLKYELNRAESILILMPSGPLGITQTLVIGALLRKAKRGIGTWFYRKRQISHEVG